MVKPNCLTRALDQWNEDKSMRLWYNSNHVIVADKEYNVSQLGHWNGSRYLPLETFGSFHFITSFQLSKKHLKLLGEYFNYISENVKLV